MRMLVLGGTAWVGGALAAEAVARGHQVTCLARGTRPVPEGARLVTADRTAAEAYDGVGGPWDAVLDVARDPAQVRGAVTALDTEWFGFVSTGSVYADTATPHLTEDAPLLDPLGTPSDDGQAYGMGKVACEEAVLGAFGDRALVARAGLIGGPGDHTGRSTYWPWRFAHPTGDAVLVPERTDRLTQVIDVRDLAEWLVRAAEQGTTGVANAVGDAMPLGAHLDAAARVAGFSGGRRPASDAWLTRRGVAEWAGERSLPLWLADPEWAGFAARDNVRAKAAGLTLRALDETLRDGLAWQREQGGRPASGLSDDDERALLLSTSAG